MSICGNIISDTGKNKLKAIKDIKPTTDIKNIWSFVGLCNFFRTHIKDFALIAAVLFKLTRKVTNQDHFRRKP